jgi:FdhE protein
MSIGEKDQRVLTALSGARKEHPELADLLDFYYDLYEAQFEAKKEITDPEVRNELAIRRRLESGRAQVTFDQLCIELESFAQLVGRVTAVLAQHHPSWQVNREDQSSKELTVLAREVFESRETLTVHKPDPKEDRIDESWLGDPQVLAVSFALAPYLQRASEVILPRLDLAVWVQGYCPICGGRPSLALFEETRGARQLMCSRCDSLWPYARVGCPFCRAADKQTYYPGAFGLYRLYVCPHCNHYLKTVDLREVHREVHPVVERLLTVGMDLAARREGYQG